MKIRVLRRLEYGLMAGMIPRLTTWLTLLALVAPALAAAQESASTAQQRELQHLRQRIEQTRQERERLKREQQALRQEAQRISTDLVRLAAQAQALEQRIADAGERIASLQKQRGLVLARLNANRAMTTRLLAALQRLRRDPPPPFVTRPDDVLSAVRGALAMGAVLPRLDERAQRLRADLRKLARLQRQLRAERAERQHNLDALRETSSRLQGMLKLKHDLLGRTRQQLAAQEQRLNHLLKQARTLNELLRAVEQQQASVASQTPREKTPREKTSPEKTPPEKRSASLAPPVERQPLPRAFDQLRGRLPWPVQGRKLAGYGEDSRLLGRLKGLYLATLPQAVVTAPARARVLLAGHFRGYGKLVILNVGQGYRILLAGLRDVSVRPGEDVRAGEPLGRMGEHPAPSTIITEDVAGKRPILYMELRKGKKLLDPSGWLIGGRRQARRN